MNKTTVEVPTATLKVTVCADGVPLHGFKIQLLVKNVLGNHGVVSDVIEAEPGAPPTATAWANTDLASGSEFQLFVTVVQEPWDEFQMEFNLGTFAKDRDFHVELIQDEVRTR